MRRACLLVCLVGCSKGGGSSRAALEAPETPASIEVTQAVDAAVSALVPTDTVASAEAREVRELYAKETDQLVWFTNTTPRPVLDSLLATLRDAGRHGLDPEEYDAESLTAQRQAIDSAGTPSTLAALDVGASRSALRFLRALGAGRVDPRSQDYRFDAPRRALDYAALVDSARRAGSLSGVIATVAPDYPEYRLLVAALAAYRGMAEVAESATVPAAGRSGKVEPGDSAWPGLPALRARLQRFGDLGDGADSTLNYDSRTVAAVRRFQGRHGLNPDGVLGGGTIAALNVGLADRVRQLEFAMERLRWFPEMGDSRAVVVNLPFYELAAYEHAHGEPTFGMRVVIGQKGEHATPIFADSISYLIFRPYWQIPTTLAARELIDPALADSTYMAANQYEIVPSHSDDAAALPPTPERLEAVRAGKLFLRQRPGPLNSLGRVKFLFPNKDDIYLHDSPARSLFGRDRRAFSHGCVRIDEPARLAAWLLDDQPKWTPAKIQESMTGAKPVTAGLKHKVPVVLWYATATVDGDGTVRFAEDPYGYDARLAKALKLGKVS